MSNLPKNVFWPQSKTIGPIKEVAVTQAPPSTPPAAIISPPVPVVEISSHTVTAADLAAEFDADPTPKTNKELYAELNRRLENVKGTLKDVEDFAEKHQLKVRFFNALYYPKTEEYRSPWGEEMYENRGPSDGYDNGPKGEWWIPSTCY